MIVSQVENRLTTFGCEVLSHANWSPSPIVVIKSGGYKIAAPDIEQEIYGLPYVFEVIVVGVEDQEYGQKIAAAVVLQGQVSFLSSPESAAFWCCGSLPPRTKISGGMAATKRLSLTFEERSKP